MSQLSPRVMLVNLDPPALPQWVTIGGQTMPLYMGAPKVTTVTGYTFSEYRGPNGTAQGSLTIIMPVASVGVGQALVICWVPTDVRGGNNLIFEMAMGSPQVGELVSKVWSCIYSGGMWTIPYLEVDQSDEAVAARSVWPETWRLRLASDVSADIGPPPNPTGPRCVPSTLALS